MAIKVPVTKTVISTTDFGVPVVNQLNGLAPTAWVNLTLTNGWVAYPGFIAPRYRKSGDIVYVMGAMKSGTSPPIPGQLQFSSLPAGFRPTFDVISGALYGGTDLWGGPGRIDVKADGSIWLVASSSMSGCTSLTAFNFSFTTT